MRGVRGRNGGGGRRGGGGEVRRGESGDSAAIINYSNSVDNWPQDYTGRLRRMREIDGKGEGVRGVGGRNRGWGGGGLEEGE